MALDANTNNEGGGGNVAIHRYTFDASHDENDLRRGIATLTPSIFDVLLDAWIDVDEVAWDGTTPLADVAPDTFWTAHGHGIFNHWQGSPVDLAQARTDLGGISQQSGVPLTQAASADALGSRRLPAMFLGDGPLKFVVSQDGTIGGDVPGSTVGACSLYLVLARPFDVAFGHRVGH